MNNCDIDGPHSKLTQTSIHITYSTITQTLIHIDIRKASQVSPKGVANILQHCNKLQQLQYHQGITYHESLEKIQEMPCRDIETLQKCYNLKHLVIHELPFNLSQAQQYLHHLVSLELFHGETLDLE